MMILPPHFSGATQLSNVEPEEKQMSDEYILDEIPEEIVKKYNLDAPGFITVWGDQKIPRPGITKTPFTQYEIVEEKGKFYVKIPKQYVPKDGG